MAPTAGQSAVSCAACMTATAAAILLWGVGAEYVHYRQYLLGSLLLAAAAIVTLLEALTVWRYLEWRLSHCRNPAAGPLCCLLPSPLLFVDTYRRAVVYAVLTVPCFVNVRHLWLPLLPGAMLLLSAAMYSLKYCCLLQKQRAIVKVPTFVRFKDESASAESQQAPPDSDGAQAPKLSHQSSFTSSHSGCSVLMGSKDSGIEAASGHQQRQRDESPAKAAVARAAARAAAPAAPANSERRSKPRVGGLVRANSSSPDRCCLINEDSLSLHN